MRERLARWLGIDITTTEMALAVSDGEQEDFSSLKMRGATCWNDDASFPAFDLAAVSGMLLELLRALGESGWRFDQGGSLSVACRQHDMVAVDDQGLPLLPALSWQCNAATTETAELNASPNVTEGVGQLEERFILPKLAMVIRRQPELRARISRVMTTGDWVLGVLTKNVRLSTSDALSNGLLDQQSRTLAEVALVAAGVEPTWFPDVVQSGHVVGDVQAAGDEPDAAWAELCRRLRGWRAVAGLGDNHASALGCGMRDQKTMVISAGTSGTVNVACPADAALNETDSPAARFEFYRSQSLLLRMLAFCGDWYNRFLGEFGGDLRDAHSLLNELAIAGDLSHIRRVECDERGECYRPGWTALSLGSKVASVQYSIALELLLHVKRMLAEVPQARRTIQQYVLTGGLSQSLFFQQVFAAGMTILDPQKAVKVSGRTGRLRYKTSAFGALLNARMPEWQNELDNLPDSLFPVAPCAAAEESCERTLRRMLLSELA